MLFSSSTIRFCSSVLLNIVIVSGYPALEDLDENNVPDTFYSGAGSKDYPSSKQHHRLSHTLHNDIYSLRPTEITHHQQLRDQLQTASQEYYIQKIAARARKFSEEQQEFRGLELGSHAGVPSGKILHFTDPAFPTREASRSRNRSYMSDLGKSLSSGS